ncbi:MAG: Flp pilus assembly protein CpaB [Acidobacteria bacterium]|nr:Flp pilus assembly protein CpaB [Acidobacteriota bacterium]
MGNLDRQKILMIFGAALVAAFLMSWFVYAKAVAPKTEKTVKLVAAARDMAAGTRLKKADMKLISVPEKDLPKNSLMDPNVGADRVLLYPINENEPLVSNKISTHGGIEGLAATIEPGKRAVSVPITDSSGAGGLIQPRSHVDVLFTRTGSMNEAVTTVLLQNVTVMGLGRNTEATITGAPGAQPAPVSSGSRAATLLVTPDQAAKLEFARQLGKISLALRNPLDTAVDQENEPVITAADLNVGDGPNKMRRRGKGGPIPNVKNDEVWKQLTAGQPVVMATDGTLAPAPKPVKEEPKEPPKPRYVIDVFRGNKHVQEIFQ